MTNDINKSDKIFVEAVRQWRLDIPKPVAWISGKVIHQYADLSGGFEPLFKQTVIQEKFHNAP